MDGKIIPSREGTLRCLRARKACVRSVLQVNNRSGKKGLTVCTTVRYDSVLRRGLLSICSGSNPNFPRKFFDPKEIREILPGIAHVVPRTSIVNVLLDRRGSPQVMTDARGKVLRRSTFA